MKSRLHYDPITAVAHLRVADAALGAVIERVGPFTLKPKPARSLFAALLRAIVFQQLNGKAASTIHGRVLDALRPHGGATPAALDKISDDALRASGLSRNKLLSVRNLAARCQAGAVPTLREAQRLSDDELLSRLTAVRGIGPWTVHMLLIFNLGRPDVMPTGDYAVRLAFRKLYHKRKEPTPETILRHARSWQPWRSVASWYLWRSLD